MKKVIPGDAVLIPSTASHVFKGIIFDVYHWQQHMHDKSTETFEMLRRPDTVEVIGIVDGRIIIIDDDQPHNGSTIGLPGGRVDDNDVSILAAAKREMLEETGYILKKWQLVNVRQPFTKIEWFIHTWVASSVDDVQKPRLDAGEKIKTSEAEYNEVKKMSMTGVGYLGESRSIFEACSSTDELLVLKAFKGQEVDR